ncbi:MAG: hypothetical protein JO345_11480 [Streptosporangiaceae bacterium]|nr:hypothetical protein [Streptosporangiaceae bacterium]
MERRFSAAFVVALWGVLNAVMAALLAGFIAAGYGATMFEVWVYGSASGLVILIALGVWWARRRSGTPLARGLRIPARPASVVLFALAVMLVWLGLPFGMWLPILAVIPLGAALMMEISARRPG